MQLWKTVKEKKDLESLKLPFISGAIIGSITEYKNLTYKPRNILVTLENPGLDLIEIVKTFYNEYRPDVNVIWRLDFSLDNIKLISQVKIKEFDFCINVKTIQQFIMCCESNIDFIYLISNKLIKEAVEFRNSFRYKTRIISNLSNCVVPFVDIMEINESNEKEFLF